MIRYKPSYLGQWCSTLCFKVNSYTINTRICEERAFVLPNNALVTTNEISTVQLHIGKFKLSLQVYIVPEISHNLISVNQLVQLGYDYHFTDGVFLQPKEITRGYHTLSQN